MQKFKAAAGISDLKSTRRIVFLGGMRVLQPRAWVCLVLAAGVIQSHAMAADAVPADKSELVYIGTYTGAKSRGIYLSRFDAAKGQLGPPELAAETRNPTFLALHPGRPLLYAAGEFDNFGGQRAGSVSAFQIEPTGKLTLLNQQASGGAGPCHLAVDRAGKCVLVANYGSGSLAAIPLQPDGRLGEPVHAVQNQGSSINPRRQTGPHGHFIIADPDNRFALACDLGLDKVFVYRLDSDRALLTPNEPPAMLITPGSGPRHLAFHPNGRTVYLLNELASTVDVFAYNPRAGTLRKLQTLSTLPEDFKGENICAEVQVHPSGKFVYASNRGHNSLAVFAVDRKSGQLSFVERQPSQGKTPRHFTLAPGGNWLLAENQDSNNVVVFRVEPKTGRLVPNGQAIEVGSPVCAVFAGGN